MKRRFISLLLICILMISLSVNAYASEPDAPKIVDNAGLLTSEEMADLSQKAYDLTYELEIDIIIVTTWGLDGKTSQEYADDFYDINGYGYGEDYSGILLLLAMETREWYMSTCGEAIYIFTDYGLERLGDEIVPWLSSGEYYYAFDVWMDALPEYVDAYRRESPVDGYAPPDEYYPQSGEEIVYYGDHAQLGAFERFLIALVIGAVSALIAVLVMRSKMNTAKFRSGASDYIKNGSYHLHHRSDMFLYSRVTKTPRPKNTNTGGRGGSSVHMGGGGRSHGGRGGRF